MTALHPVKSTPDETRIVRSDLDLLVVEPSRLSWAQWADLRDRFEASDLPFRVDVVEAEGLPSGMTDRVASESVSLRDL